MTLAGLPHSEIPGSKPVCGSPRLIAAYHVLLRLSAPRHPPCTLSSLTKLEYSLPGESYRFLPDSVVKELRPLLESALASDNRSRTIEPKATAHSSAQLVGLGRFELPTSRLSGVRSNQLSYRPREGKPVPWKLGRGQRYSRTIDLGFCQAFHPLRLQTGFLRKEVIQPQVLLQLPCYDFTPFAEHTMDGCFPEGLAHRLPVQPTFVM